MIEQFAKEMQEKIEKSQTLHIVKCFYCHGDEKRRKDCFYCEGRGFLIYLFYPERAIPKEKWDKYKICEVPREKLKDIEKLTIKELRGCC